MDKKVSGPARRAPAGPAVRWSAQREAIFLRTLAETVNVSNAVRASGLSSASVYRRRDTVDTFREAWAAALRQGYVRLETEMLGRALNGVRKPVWYAGKKVGSVLEYSDRLALSLLTRHADGKAPRAEPQDAEETDARAALIAALARMNQSMGGRG